MQRRSRLTIRLSKSERLAVDALADAERLPTSTLARRLLLLEAERKGLLEPAVNRQASRGECQEYGARGEERR